MLERFYSPGNLLARLFFQKEDQFRLILLTGPRGAGKTSWCLDLAAAAKQQGVSLGGLISPAVYERFEKVGIDLVDVAAGMRRQLAYRRSLSSTDHAIDEVALSTNDWRFDADVLAWGNKILERSLACDLFILDEVGPLEFERGLGFQSGLLHIDAQAHKLSVVVIRPSLIAQAQERWPWSTVLQVGSRQGAKQS